MTGVKVTKTILPGKPWRVIQSWIHGRFTLLLLGVGLTVTTPLVGVRAETRKIATSATITTPSVSDPAEHHGAPHRHPVPWKFLVVAGCWFAVDVKRKVLDPLHLLLARLQLGLRWGLRITGRLQDALERARHRPWL